MFNPGETVSHQFIIPFVAEEISKIIVTYKQDGDVVLEKTITSGFETYETDKTRILVTFSQADSLLFKPEYDYTIQLNVLISNNGSFMRASSKEIKGKNGIQYHREVISDE